MLVVLAGLAPGYYALMLRDMLMPQLHFEGIWFLDVFSLTHSILSLSLSLHNFPLF